MSDPIQKPGHAPESYSPKAKPEIMKLAEQINSPQPQEPAPQQPELLTRGFLLAGFEAAIDLKDEHWAGMDKVKAALKENLHRLGNAAQPMRFFDVWEADPTANYKKKKNHSKRYFFLGVEVTSLEGIPEGFLAKDFPETTFALFKEREHGSPKFTWLVEAGYTFDTQYAERHAMDIEIYDDIDDEGQEWDALIPIEPPEGYTPKGKPEILKLAQEAQAPSIAETGKYPKRYRVTERGARKKGRHCPHDMAYPSMISALKTFLGMPSRIVKKGEWLDDLDYFFQMGISLEGFGLFHGVPLEYDGYNRWGDQPLRNSLAAEGILHHIAALDGAAIHDTLFDPQALKAEVCAHLAGDKPLLITKRGSGRLLLVTGYREHGDVLIANPFSGGDHERNIAVRLKKNAKKYSGWMQGLRSVIYIDGVGAPADRGVIIRQALRAAYEMLTDTRLACDMEDDNYYYGSTLYEKWIARLDNDDNYRSEQDKHRYLHPEDFDLAERRWYAAHFFMECEEYLGQAALAAAIQAFKDIHDYMWDIHRLGMEKNDGKLLEREARDEIIAILKKCGELDLLAAGNIREALERVQT